MKYPNNNLIASVCGAFSILLPNMAQAAGVDFISPFSNISYDSPSGSVFQRLTVSNNNGELDVSPSIYQSVGTSSGSNQTPRLAGYINFSFENINLTPGYQLVGYELSIFHAESYMGNGYVNLNVSANGSQVLSKRWANDSALPPSFTGVMDRRTFLVNSLGPLDLFLDFSAGATCTPQQGSSTDCSFGDAAFLAIDHVTIKGITVAVPEPESVALLGVSLSLFGLGATKRRIVKSE